MRLLWLPDVLRAEGLKVVELDGWERRGRDLNDVTLVVCHHTASGPKSSDTAVAKLLRDGRPDLPGPLCQLGLQRDGTYVVVAAGKGNHNGHGTGGNQTIGIEAYNDGVGEPWPTGQVDAYEKGCAAICRHLGWDASRVQGHKETDPRRKIDPTGIDMDGFRLGVTALLNDTPPPEEADMPLSDADLAKIDALILKRLQPLNDRVTDLHAEVVEPRDGDGKSRMDRIAELVTTLRKKP